MARFRNRDASSRQRGGGVPTLELLLRSWEDFWCVFSAFERAEVGLGKTRVIAEERAMVHWRRFRRFLTGVHQLAAAQEHSFADLTDFSPPNVMEPSAYGFLVEMASAFTSWQLLSRRIYRLSQEVEAILGHTALGDVSWRDLEPPFPSFVIELAEPWIDPDSGPVKQAYDTLIATKAFRMSGEGPKEFWELRFVSAARHDYTPLSRVQRERLTTAIRREEWKGVRGQAMDCMTNLSRVTGAIFALDGESLDEPVVQTAARVAELRRQSGLEGVCRGSEKCLNQMVRIFAGLILYLRSLPASSPYVPRVGTAPRLSTPDRAVITDGAAIFSVQSTWRLSREERVALGLAGTREEREALALAWHFREAHWRRPPGQGTNAEAKRSVHVRWTMVRRDRMPANLGLPMSGEKQV